MNSTSETLRGAAEYIEKHGWTQGTLKDAQGKVCALGAIRYATYEMNGVGVGHGHPSDYVNEGRATKIVEEQQAACAALAAVISDATGVISHPLEIPKWNDANSTSREDVLLAFKRAAERAEDE